MHDLNEYVVSICFVMIFCIVIQMLTPSKRYKGIVKIVLGIFILYTLIPPLNNLLNSDFSDIKLSEEAWSESLVLKENHNYEDTLYSVTENSLQNDIKTLFNENGVNVFFDEGKTEIFISGISDRNRIKIYEYFKNIGIEVTILE